MDLGSIADRDECVQKKQIGAVFLVIGALILWGTLFFNKENLFAIFKEYF
jgi:hypothetical protein